MSTKLKGTIYGIIAAVSYGTNPLGALLLYQEGINAHSVLFYRFSLAVVLLALLMLVQKKSFAVNRKELAVLASLGVLFAVSSLTFFTSFHHMDAGISATMLFVYPVMVAHFPGRIAVGKGIARSVVQKVAQEDHLVGRLRLDAFHEGFAPQRRSVDIRCHEKLHRSFLSSSSMLRARLRLHRACSRARAVTP